MFLVKGLRERFWKVISGPEEEQKKFVKSKFAEFETGVRLTVADKSESWMLKKRIELNNTWKKVKHSTQSMFCDKGKHERCTFDPDCTCDCHPVK